MSPPSPDSTATHRPAGQTPPTSPPVVVVRDAVPDDPALLPFLRARLKQILPFHLFLASAMLALDVGQGDTFTPLRLAILGAGVAGQGALILWFWGRSVLTARAVVRTWWVSTILLYVGIAWVQFDSVRRPDVTERAFAPEVHSSLGAAFARGWVLPWYGLLVSAAVLAPVHPRRWYIAYGFVVGMVVAGIFVAGYAVNDQLRGASLGQLLGQTLFWVLLGTVLALFGRLRYEGLRQQAEHAQRFGQYQLVRKLGEGGMGEVHLAEHLLLKRPSVIKMVRADRATDPALLARFEREVKVLATLTHPNTVQVFDYGYTADGTFYYVMEYLPGLDLNRLVESHGPLPPGRAVYLLRQVCRALREAHAAGLIHRDVKPSNVMLCERGGVPDVAKLLDFGLVQADAGDLGRLTTYGSLLGTPAFMSAEQAERLPTDSRSDIYSLGATAYFLLTGRPVFERESAMRVMMAHITDPPPPLGPGAPDDVAAVVLRCLAKKPADRFADVRELEVALTACGCAAGWDEERAAAWWSANRGGASAATAGAPTATW